MAGFFRRALIYLGLVEDDEFEEMLEYEEGRVEMPEPAPSRRERPSGHGPPQLSQTFSTAADACPPGSAPPPLVRIPPIQRGTPTSSEAHPQPAWRTHPASCLPSQPPTDTYTPPIPHGSRVRAPINPVVLGRLDWPETVIKKKRGKNGKCQQMV